MTRENLDIFFNKKLPSTSSFLNAPTCATQLIIELEPIFRIFQTTRTGNNFLDLRILFETVHQAQ